MTVASTPKSRSGSRYPWPRRPSHVRVQSPEIGRWRPACTDASRGGSTAWQLGCPYQEVTFSAYPDITTILEDRAVSEGRSFLYTHFDRSLLPDNNTKKAQAKRKVRCVVQWCSPRLSGSGTMKSFQNGRSPVCPWRACSWVTGLRQLSTRCCAASWFCQ